MSTAAANAARQKAACKHKIAAYVAEYYASTSKPLAQGDIIKALGLKKNAMNRSVRELQHEGRIHCIGLASDVDREDLAANVRLYGPVTAPLLPAAGKLRALQSKAPLRPYVGKPPALREARVKAPKYVGEVGRQYERTWKPLEPSPEFDWRDVAKLRMMTR